MSADELRLRTARASDVEFLFRLQRAAMEPHAVRAYGFWDEARQKERFHADRHPESHEIVELAGTPVGCRWVREHPDGLELVRLYLLPEAQGRGIGTRLVTELCARADRVGLPVRLRVLQVNPARRLYERLGFRIMKTTEFHYQMERRP